MTPDSQPDASRGRPSSPIFGYAMAAFVVSALVLGGASRENALNDTILRLISLPILTWAVWRLSHGRTAGKHVLAIGLLLAVLALPLMQMLPLPPEIWGALPSQGALIGEFHQLGLETGWRPLSLAPAATLEVFLSLLPPAAVFLGAMTLDRSARSHVTLAIVAVILTSVVLGALQVAGGPDSSLRFYETTNDRVAVGFFANRNHWAASLVIAFPLITALLTAGCRASSSVVYHALASAAFAVLLIGIAISGSRAGLVLALPALGSALAIILKRGNVQRRRLHGLSLAAGASLALVAISIAGAWFALGRLDATNLENEVRFDFWRRTAALAIDHLPMGAGGGSFPAIYPSAEPVEALRPAYANHAHNDFVELFLEYGVGGVVIILFATVLSVRALRSNRPDKPVALCHLLVLLLLAGHSTVDYPLRTLAVAVVFAFSLSAVLTTPLASTRQ